MDADETNSQEPGREPGLDEAYERYRRARERYAVAKYEYKAAKYALKAARLREQSASGQGGASGKRHGKYDKYDKHAAYGKYGQYASAGGTAQGSGTLGPVATRDTSDRRKGRQLVLEVLATERIGEHFQRLTLGGPGFEDFRDNNYTDKYVKILFVDPSLGIEPPYDVQELRRSLPKHQRPVRRTYTVHSVDHEARSLVIDFVLHGDSGVAGPWAARAAVGDKVAFSGPGGKYAPSPSVDAHLLVADESALPAVSAALAALSASAPAAVGKAFIEVAGPDDEWDLVKPEGIEVTWVHRGGPYVPGRSPLVAAVEGIAPDDWPAGRVQAFVHGEKTLVKYLHRHLTDQRGVDRRLLSMSSYWTFGKADD
jgi:NADPH-dependent ferric siderophore reductase